MVCLGNICRSPIAEGLMLHKIQQYGLDWQVDSAGTESYHIGSAPHRHSQDICQRNGIDICHQRARQFSRKDFERYDKIYALAEDVYEEIQRIGGKDADMNRVDLLLNELNPGSNESVPDPYYGGADGYIFVYELIERSCEAIIAKYK
ncbi:MAG: low molecular weight phosphotyrosine protein phosphatase [Taibaiella sp.]|nr:low molecular weight phosphotyrosine protein phosphatase [Taibaiella sp.]